MLDIQTVVDALEMTDNLNRFYLDLDTQETVSLSEYDPQSTEDVAFLMENNPDRFIALPTQRDINEYSIMEQFIESMPSGEAKRGLEVAIQGRGAFRRFKDRIYYFGIEESWFAFRRRTYQQIAKAWCEEHGIEYTAPAEEEHEDRLRQQIVEIMREDNIPEEVPYSIGMAAKIVKATQLLHQEMDADQFESFMGEIAEVLKKHMK